MAEELLLELEDEEDDEDEDEDEEDEEDEDELDWELDPLFAVVEVPLELLPPHAARLATASPARTTTAARMEKARRRRFAGCLPAPSTTGPGLLCGSNSMLAIPVALTFAYMLAYMLFGLVLNSTLGNGFATRRRRGTPGSRSRAPAAESASPRR